MTAYRELNLPMTRMQVERVHAGDIAVVSPAQWRGPGALESLCARDFAALQCGETFYVVDGSLTDDQVANKIRPVVAHAKPPRRRAQ